MVQDEAEHIDGEDDNIALRPKFLLGSVDRP